jgi:anti-sigma factor RsiW
MPESDDLQGDLAHLADGTLPQERAAQLRAQVQADPTLAVALERQERAVHALRTLDVPAPAPLRAELRAATTRRSRGPVFSFAPGAFGALGRLSAALAVGLAALLVALLPGGGSPSVAQAASFALRPSSLPAPRPVAGDATRLQATIDGVWFPSWNTIDWRAVGARRGTVKGRRLLAVRYTGRGWTIGYAVAAGQPLHASGGSLVRYDGSSLRVLALSGGTTAVTWLRSGHSCVIAAHAVPSGVLLRLAERDLR